MISKKQYSYDYPRVALTVDCILFGLRNGRRDSVLLIERKNDPFRGAWAFPGGFHDPGETVEEAVARELEEETGLDVKGLKQFAVYSAVDRDPREQVVSVAFYGEAEIEECEPVAKDDAAKVAWFPLSALPSLAFDHARILSDIIGE